MYVGFIVTEHLRKKCTLASPNVKKGKSQHFSQIIGMKNVLFTKHSAGHELTWRKAVTALSDYGLMGRKTLTFLF